MMTVSYLPDPPYRDDDVLLGHEIDDLLLSLRGLVLVRDLLAERGASPEEIDQHSREADRVRARLAALIVGGSPLAPAAA
ncbi:MAG TPA: hypothetical protein VM785_11415 [Gaiellales bacterium]|nr:hypothetical protein [Gaiellales bacterium]